MKHIIISLISAALIINCTYSMDNQTGKEVVVHHRLHDVFAGKKIHFMNIPAHLKHLFVHAEPHIATVSSSEASTTGFHPILSLETKVEDKLIEKAETVVIDFAYAKLEEEKNKLYNVVVYKVAPLAITFILGYLVAKHSSTNH